MKEISYEGPSFFEKNKAKKAERSRGSEAAPTIRTFRADVEGMIEEKGVTKTQMVMAEESRRESRGESRILHDENPHLGRIIFILSLILTFGIGVGVYVFMGSTIGFNKSPSVIEKPLTQDNAEILITNSPREQIMADISINFGKTTLAIGGTRDIHFITKESDGSSRNATTEEVLNAISISSPSMSFVRSVDEELQYAAHVETGALIGYLLFTSRSYPNTFAGTLEWESTMAKDVIPVLTPLYPRKDIKDLSIMEFRDERILGHDARVLRDEEGKIVLLYTFIDRKKLIITGGEETLFTVLRKEKDRPVATSTPQTVN